MKTQASQSSAGSPSAAKPVILVVDDSRLMRLALTKILREEFEVLEAVNGEDGWSKLESHEDIQMVFSDLSMPELDGFGLLERIRQADTQRIREVPVVVITGNEDDEGMRKRALACGASDFVGKPFQTVEIKARAHNLVEQQRKIAAASQVVDEVSTEDAVTHLVNQRHFGSRAAEALSFARRHKAPLGLLGIEIDDYATLCADWDDEVSAAALQLVAQVLRSHTRDEDIVSHFGEGRFNALLPATDLAGASQLARRVVEAVADAPVMHDGEPVAITVSVGVSAPMVGAKDDLGGLLQMVDGHVNRAVEQGGNRWVADPVTAGQPRPAADKAAEVEQLTAQIAELRRQLQEQVDRVAREAGARRQAEEQAARFRNELDEYRGRDDGSGAKLQAEREARLCAEREAEQLAERLEAQSTRINELQRGRQRAQDELASFIEASHVSQHRADREISRLKLTLIELRNKLEHESAARSKAECQLGRPLLALWICLRRLVWRRRKTDDSEA